jgi:hypothetical protein
VSYPLFLYLFTLIFLFDLGYALRKHIAEALQKRSAAIRTALDLYNSAAKALQPPHTTLKWDDVVEYAFLSDFNLLCDTRQDVQHRQWATPAGCLALDTHFKILRACEEIERLNIEVRRMATHIRDEELFLHARENATRDIDPNLAHQIALYRMVRGRFNSHHIRCIRQIAGLLGFTGTASVGVSVDVVGDGVEAPTEQNVGQRDEEDGQEFTDLQEDQEDQEEEEQLDNDILDILTVAMDNTQLSHR